MVSGTLFPSVVSLRIGIRHHFAFTFSIFIIWNRIGEKIIRDIKSLERLKKKIKELSHDGRYRPFQRRIRTSVKATALLRLWKRHVGYR